MSKMSVTVCKGCRTTLSNEGVKECPRLIKLKNNTAKLGYYSTSGQLSGTRKTMASRTYLSNDGRDQGGFEGKGMVLLLVCGLYAVFLFIVGALANYALSKATSSVKSLFCRVEVAEVKKIHEGSDDNNNDTKLQRRHTTSVSHG